LASWLVIFGVELREIPEIPMTPLMMLGLTFIVGFAGGYSVRAQISQHRRRRYGRA
jgi:hypothetical protein